MELVACITAANSGYNVPENVKGKDKDVSGVLLSTTP
jgi:hypothetical protein